MHKRPIMVQIQKNQIHAEISVALLLTEQENIYRYCCVQQLSRIRVFHLQANCKYLFVERWYKLFSTFISPDCIDGINKYFS